MYRGKGVQKHENEFATIGPIKKNRVNRYVYIGH